MSDALPHQVGTHPMDCACNEADEADEAEEADRLT